MNKLSAEKLVPLAREFHELGGNGGYKIQVGDWVIRGENIYLFVGINSNTDKIIYDDKSAHYVQFWPITIPIHDSDFLWKFIDESGARFSAEKLDKYLEFARMQCHTYALYSAAIQILKWRKEKP